jgi:transposase
MYENSYKSKHELNLSVYWLLFNGFRAGQYIKAMLCIGFNHIFFAKGFLRIGLILMAVDTSNQSEGDRTLKRLQVGGLPLIHAICERMRLKNILYKYMPAHGNESIPAVETLMLLVYNLIIGKYPLYELPEWVGSIDLRCTNAHNYEHISFNDDRFGRMLNKLYDVDRASLMTELVVFFVKEFNIDLVQLSNDSTTIKAFGRYPGRTSTGLALKKGHSKDHRPDLKQLLFTLTVSGDGAVPIHYKCYSGNVTDDKTHIETWESLKAIARRSDFLYVADSKLCTDEQLSHIVKNGGRAVTIIPEHWKEVKSFKRTLRTIKKPKEIIWRRTIPGKQQEEKKEYFSVFKGHHVTIKKGHRIHWIYSSEKRKRDRKEREARLKKVEQSLAALNGKINKRNLKTKEDIFQAANQILVGHNLQECFHISIGETKEKTTVQVGRGRPGKKTKYRTKVNTLLTLTWTKKKSALQQEAQIDGVFPLLCTDHRLTAKEVLKAYKYQPRLEKRFSQFKTIHNASPLLFKKVERIEANMFGFFIALVIQALIEREVRKNMKEQEIEKLRVYPEQRDATHPTTCKILDRFENICIYKIMSNSIVVETFRDSLNENQKLILKLLNIGEDQYWEPPIRQK